MPTYEYKCASCSHELEAFQKITDPPLTDCPVCKKSLLQRGIGGGQAFIQLSGKSSQGSSSQPSGCCPCGKGSCRTK